MMTTGQSAVNIPVVGTMTTLKFFCHVALRAITELRPALRRNLVKGASGDGVRKAIFIIISIIDRNLLDSTATDPFGE